MHTLNLGMVAFMAGSTLRVLTQENHWQAGSEDKQLKAAFKNFSAWAKQEKIPFLAQCKLDLYTLNVFPRGSILMVCG